MASPRMGASTRGNTSDEKRERVDVSEPSRSCILDLKKAPYLRADAARRNRRKTQELMKQISRDVLATVTHGSNNVNSSSTEVHF